MAFWVVRAGRRGEFEDRCLEQEMVAVGTPALGDLRDLEDGESLRAAVAAHMADATAGRIGQHVGQLRAIRDAVVEGSLVAMPLKSRGSIAFGVVAGPYRFDPTAPTGAAHQRPVRWLATDVPRSAIDQDILYSMGSLLAVFRVTRNGAEERVRTLVSRWTANGATVSGPPIGLAEDGPPGTASVAARLPSTGSESAGGPGPEPEAPVDVIEYAHDRIRARVGAAFREHGLTTLVACLLEAEGFTCLESPPGPDGGVDIIAGRGRMGFDGPRLVVQVKSGERPVGVGVLRELQGVMRSFGAEHGLLVSWSGFNDVVLREARRTWFHLRLWTADDVIEALQAHYERLPEAIRAEIPLQRVWAPVEDPA